MFSDLTLATALELMLLLLAANGLPVLAKRLLDRRWSYPLDGGCKFIDGRPLLGPSKTIRGLVVGALGTAAAAALLGLPWLMGLQFGLLSLAGDALSSFAKRRLNIPSSGMALGLDQIPEALLPLWVLRETLGLQLGSVVALVGLFVIGELLLSRIMFRVGVRDRPY